MEVPPDLAPKRLFPFNDVALYRPSIVYFGASQRIYGIRWQLWGGPTARGTDIYPVNDCVPYCAARSITPYPVTVRLSRRPNL